ncbi:hypothetical protein M409DRAFT_27824 [Zasmidium cellare ATCC 36951]|uniref:Uncharacterized protein n=1 Tax=Zasmidium cellare ATCC 36951 TaxID=1080233 RepID=A0A6A6C691_ZASCE|nr:uncharacterized protein M409DRAFT_27824 [Zasmidium cellare ATCC 36951]KAF2161768.1 hypothetical protein M409DRAFT_27824 [Zasmidium cellare ATCC 36951]
MSGNQSQNTNNELLDAVQQAFNDMESRARVLQATMRDTVERRQRQNPASGSVSTQSTGTQTDRSLTLNGSQLDFLEGRLRSLQTVLSLWARVLSLSMADKARIVAVSSISSAIAEQLQIELGPRLGELVQQFADIGMMGWVNQERSRIAAARAEREG